MQLRKNWKLYSLPHHIRQVFNRCNSERIESLPRLQPSFLSSSKDATQKELKARTSEMPEMSAMKFFGRCNSERIESSENVLYRCTLKSQMQLRKNWKSARASTWTGNSRSPDATQKELKGHHRELDVATRNGYRCNSERIERSLGVRTMLCGSARTVDATQKELKVVDDGVAIGTRTHL